MTYKIKVTLEGIKGFYRIYKSDSKQTLYALHKRMRSDMEFPQDQLILFKAFDAEGSVAARYGLFDLGDGAVDAITFDDIVKKGICSFKYFYDVTSKKSVNVTIEGTMDEASDAPALIEVKGPNPVEFENGYVAFEDLPDDKRHLPGEGGEKKNSLAELLGMSDEDGDDDDDDDEDGEDEDKEEEDIIYDENE